MATELIQISNGVDDAHQRANGTGFSHTSNNVEMAAATAAGSRWHGGFRFNPSTISQGDTINLATLETFVVSGYQNSKVNCFCEDADNPPPFNVMDVNSRARTAATVPMTHTFPLGNARQAWPVDLAAIVAAVVGRSTWAEAIIVILVEGVAEDVGARFISRSFDWGAVSQLTIDFEPGAGPPDLAVDMGVANVTATGDDLGVEIAPAAGVATVTVTADPVAGLPDLSVTAGVATVTVTGADLASDPRLGIATVAVSGVDLTPELAPAAGVATVTVTGVDLSPAEAQEATLAVALVEVVGKALTSGVELAADLGQAIISVTGVALEAVQHRAATAGVAVVEVRGVAVLGAPDQSADAGTALVSVTGAALAVDPRLSVATVSVTAAGLVGEVPDGQPLALLQQATVSVTAPAIRILPELRTAAWLSIEIPAGNIVRVFDAYGAVPGVQVQRAGGMNGPGVGKLRINRGLLSWMEPRGLIFGRPVDVSGGGSFYLPGGDDPDAWLLVDTYASRLPQVPHTASVELLERVAARLAGPEATEGESAVTTRSYALKNNHPETLTNLTAWLDPDEPANRDVALQLASSGFHQPWNEAEGMALLGTHNVPAQISVELIMQRSLVTPAAHPGHRISWFVSFDDGQGGRAVDRVFGLYRVRGTAKLQAYSRDGSDPDVRADAPYAETTGGLPWTPKTTFLDGAQRYVLGNRNPYALEGMAARVRWITLQAGVEIGHTPDAPLQTRLTQLPGGAVRIHSMYLTPVDQDRRADRWVVRYTTNGSEPLPGSPELSARMKRGTGGVATFVYDLPAQPDGTMVKVLARSSRAQIESANANVVSHEVKLTGPDQPAAAGE